MEDQEIKAGLRVGFFFARTIFGVPIINQAAEHC